MRVGPFHAILISIRAKNFFLIRKWDYTKVKKQEVLGLKEKVDANP